VWSMSARVLFVVNGLGLGNSTRCHAVIRHLVEAGATVSVMTSGNGLWYFRGRPEVAELHELEALAYGKDEKGRLSIAGTLAMGGHFVGVFRRNDHAIARQIEAFRPNVAVIDSSYSICSLRAAKLPVVALNNADVVHVSYRSLPGAPPSTRAQFLVVEENDYRFHRWVPDVVISPSLDPGLPEVGKPFRRIGPIVRPGYDPRPTSGPPQRVVVMLSGSTFGTPVRFQETWPGLHIDVVGRDAPEGEAPRDGVVYHGRLKDNREVLEAADLAICNGGFSAVSELFCMRKPMVVIPVPNHAEQWVNAATVKALGVGTIGSEETLEADLREALGRIDELRGGYARLPPARDGALEGARVILEAAKA